MTSFHGHFVTTQGEHNFVLHGKRKSAICLKGWQKVTFTQSEQPFWLFSGKFYINHESGKKPIPHGIVQAHIPNGISIIPCGIFQQDNSHPTQDN